MTQNAKPGPEDHGSSGEGEGQQSRLIEPVSEVDDPPDQSEGPQFRRVDPGPEDDDPPEEDQQSRRVDLSPEDDDPPPPPKRPQVISFFRSLRHGLARLFHRP